MKDNKSIFWELLADDISEEISDTNAEQLNQTLNHNHELKRIYKLIHATRIKNGDDKIETDKNEILQMTYDKIFETKEKQNKKLLLFTRLNIVASVALMFGLCWFSYWLGNKNNIEENWIEYYCQSGGISKLILSDSTEVFLNAGTKFRYPAQFKENIRKVEIDGEAYFNVRQIIEQPFVVENKAFSIKVLGTSFNVKAYNTDSVLETTLVNGSIEIVTNKGNDTYILKPNEQGTMIASTGQLFLKEVDIEYYISWKDGDLNFNQMTFSEICKLLERKFGVCIIIKNLDLSKERFTGRFINGEGLYQILDIIKENTHFNYKLEDKNSLIIYL